jgi:hypothetical protein
MGFKFRSVKHRVGGEHFWLARFETIGETLHSTSSAITSSKATPDGTMSTRSLGVSSEELQAAWQQVKVMTALPNVRPWNSSDRATEIIKRQGICVVKSAARPEATAKFSEDADEDSSPRHSVGHQRARVCATRWVHPFTSSSLTCPSSEPQQIQLHGDTLLRREQESEL